jgi:hypothetical protein
MKFWCWTLSAAMTLGIACCASQTAGQSQTPDADEQSRTAAPRRLPAEAVSLRSIFSQNGRQPKQTRPEVGPVAPAKTPSSTEAPAGGAKPLPAAPDTAYEQGGTTAPAKAAPTNPPAGPQGEARPGQGFVSPGAAAAPGGALCDTGCNSACGACQNGGGRPLQLDCLTRRGIEVGGWLDSGITWSAHHGPDRYNGVVTFNDRDGEFQMNQFYTYLKRVTKTDGCGSDLGGRFDFLYGTDSRFTQAQGLEDSFGMTERFYQVALPQFYVDLAVNDWVLRAGHFYAPIGFESVMAPENFFYSHSYTHQYGEPFTFTGMELIRTWDEQTSFNFGFHRGWDHFTDKVDGKDALSAFGGLNWKSANERVDLAMTFTAGEEGLGNSTWMYSFVGKLQLSERLKYIFQQDYGQSVGGALQTAPKAEWYSINQYMLYDVNCRWSAGLRFEWFRDNNGVRVSGVGDKSPLTPFPDNLHTGPYVGNFYEVTAGLNWKPYQNVVVRPELRWDWFDGTSTGVRPFAGNRNDQFLAAVDAILSF